MSSCRSCAGAVVASLAPGYPELPARLNAVQRALRTEEATFVRTLDRGSEMLDALISEAIVDCTMLLVGEDVFTLHDTYGFPIELTREIASERGVAVDTTGFDEKMNEQRVRARADAAAKRATVTVSDLPTVRSEFSGYEGLTANATILAILVDGASVERRRRGRRSAVDSRPFVVLRREGRPDRRPRRDRRRRRRIRRDRHAATGAAIVHHGIVRHGALAVGDAVETLVFPEWRAEIRRHHTSAHLLQHALRDVLGTRSSRPARGSASTACASISAVRAAR